MRNTESQWTSFPSSSRTRTRRVADTWLDVPAGETRTLRVRMPAGASRQTPVRAHLIAPAPRPSERIVMLWPSARPTPTLPVEGTLMRILLLSQFYPPDFGGVEHHVSALAHGLAQRGHEVAVATFAARRDSRPSAADDGVDRAPRRRPGSAGSARCTRPIAGTRRRSPTRRPCSRSRRVVRAFEPDIVHAHNWLGRSFLPLKRSSGARYVVTLHDCGRTCAQGRMMYRGERLCESGDAARLHGVHDRTTTAQ